MKSKIILGSANFDQKYGITKNLIKKKQIEKLLSIAFKNKIKRIDTSPDYSKSEKIIGLLNNNRFKIISKIPKKPKKISKQNISKWVMENVMNSLSILKIKKLECLLLQDANSLLGKNGKEIYRSIKNIKSRNLTTKIGISIYDFKTLGKILKNFKFDLIQIPFNIFDQRLITEGWLRSLKKKKIEVHARSIFLQGTLLLKKNELPKYLKKFGKHWSIWENWIKKNKLNPLQACLLFVLNQKEIDGIVLGCDNINQFNQILKVKKNNFLMPKFNITNSQLLDLRKWSN